MNEIELREVLGIIRRRWVAVVGLFVAALAAAIVLTVLAPPQWNASTTIRIDEEQAGPPIIEALEFSGGSEVETEMAVLRSRTLAEEVVDSLGLMVRVVSPRGVARDVVIGDLRVDRRAPEASYRIELGSGDAYLVFDEADENLGRVSTTLAVTVPGISFRLAPGALDYDELRVTVTPFAETVDRLRKQISVSRLNREANIVAVIYQSADSQLVQEVPNTLARRFIQQRRSIQKSEARSTVLFLEEQLDTLTGQLRLAEDALTRFREAERVVSLEAEGETQLSQLAELETARNAIAAERSALRSLVERVLDEARSQRPEAPSPYRQLVYFPTLLRNQATSTLLQSLADADAERTALLRGRTIEDPDVVNLTEQIQGLEAQLRSTALTYLEGLEAQVRSYDEILGRFASDLERIPSKELQMARLRRDVEGIGEIYGLLQTRLQEARIVQAVDDASVRIVDPAVRPPEPAAPRPLMNLLLGAVLGLILGVGAAFAAEYMDDTLHTKEDIQAVTGHAPLLGMIPGHQPADGTPRVQAGHLEARLVAGRDPGNPVSEAYRALRTNLTFARPERPPKTIVVTSALPQDGKSTVASNLAVTLLQQGTRVLLVDADLRRGVLNTVFAAEREPGLANILVGQIELGDAVTKVEVGAAGTLDFLPSGPFPPNPAELLGSPSMDRLVASMEERYDVVLFDSAPLAVVTDAAVLGSRADGTLLVARAGKTERAAVLFAYEQLVSARTALLGTVLNDLHPRRDTQYGSTYGRYGSHTDATGPAGVGGRLKNRLTAKDRS